jgi:hypothetical protein
MMLAADLESRLEKEYRNSPESEVRRHCEAAVASDEKRFHELRRHELAQDAAKRARAKLPLARSLEKMRKTTGEINFYREIARDAVADEVPQVAQDAPSGHPVGRRRTGHSPARAGIGWQIGGNPGAVCSE